MNMREVKKEFEQNQKNNSNMLVAEEYYTNFGKATNKDNLFALIKILTYTNGRREYYAKRNVLNDKLFDMKLNSPDDLISKDMGLNKYKYEFVKIDNEKVFNHYFDFVKTNDSRYLAFAEREEI